MERKITKAKKDITLLENEKLQLIRQITVLRRIAAEILVTTASSDPAIQPVLQPVAINPSLDTSLPMDINRCESMVAECEIKLKQAELQKAVAIQEKTDFCASRTMSDPVYQAIMRNWMTGVSNILWPENANQVTRSHPISAHGYPPAVQEAIDTAYQCSIYNEVDVRTVLNDLAMVNWYYRALCTIQSPPTTKALRDLLSEPVARANSTDRTVKFLSAVLTRIWYANPLPYVYLFCLILVIIAFGSPKFEEFYRLMQQRGI